jgi:hypothetical protein
VYVPPLLTFTFRVVAAIAGAALRPITAPAVAAINRRLLARLINVMDGLLDRVPPDTSGIRLLIRQRAAIADMLLASTLRRRNIAAQANVDLD